MKHDGFIFADLSTLANVVTTLATMGKNNEENQDQNLSQQQPQIQIPISSSAGPAQSSVAKAFDTLAKAVNQTSQVFTQSEPKNIQNLLSAMVIMLFLFLFFSVKQLCCGEDNLNSI